MDVPLSLAGLTTLVVDPQAVTRNLVIPLLREYGANLEEADSAAQALAILRETRVDVILAFPGEPGRLNFEIIHEIRMRTGHWAQPETVPAVAVLLLADVEDRVGILQAGFQAHILKPIDPAELVCIIAALASWRARSGNSSPIWAAPGQRQLSPDEVDEDPDRDTQQETE